MAPLLYFLIYSSFASKLVEYRFGYNYGQVFHDFSGNFRDGVNGVDSTTTTSDTTVTDRGVLFLSTSTSRITLPINDQQATALVLPSTFTIAAWFMSFSGTGGTIFYRYKDANNYFSVIHNTTNQVANVLILIGGVSSGTITGGNYSFDVRNY